MVRFLLVLAWVVIQGEIKTWSVLFALFKFVQYSCWNYFAVPTIINFPYTVFFSFVHSTVLRWRKSRIFCTMCLATTCSFCHCKSLFILCGNISVSFVHCWFWQNFQPQVFMRKLKMVKKPLRRSWKITSSFTAGSKRHIVVLLLKILKGLGKRFLSFCNGSMYALITWCV